MAIKYFSMRLNLQQGIVHINEPNCCNGIVAIYDEHKRKIIVRFEYKNDVNAIVAAISDLTDIPTFDWEIDFVDGFRIDTWNGKLYPENN